MEHIISKHNPLWTQLRKLQNSRAYRYETGQFAADGTKLLDEAIRWYPGLNTVILDESIPVPDLPSKVRIVQVPADLLKSVSTVQTPQGAVFVCDMPKTVPLRLTPGCLILDGIQDPGNLGTILRTADAMEIPVVLTQGCTDPYSPKTVRASMGAVFRTQPQQTTMDQIIACCHQQKIPLAVTALSERAVDIRSAALKNCAVVIGSEGQGVSECFLQQADQLLIIPMNQRCESLNAAVAATVVLWEMRR